MYLSESSLLTLLNQKIAASNNSEVYKPLFFRLEIEAERKELEELLISKPAIKVFDTISFQLNELIKVRNPSLKLTEKELTEKVSDHILSKPLNEYGVWVYYPWAEKLIHIVDEKEFVELRTNRNKYKITDRERDILLSKKIGVIGLSVGQSVALTLVMERLCGELRIADFDTLELTNYNRIRTGLYNLNVEKTITAAREIAEIDPFVKVTCFHEGITEQNIDKFFTEGGNLNLLVEECDSLDIKVFSRQKAKEYGVPVLMDTNDKGMLDIERYDLQRDYPLFHGLMGNVDYTELKGLTVEQKIPYVLKLVGLNTASARSKASLIELGQSITNFPQLASSVVLGGALVADVSRRILLDQLKDSGRFYVDIEEIIKDKIPSEQKFLIQKQAELGIDEMREISEKIPVRNSCSFIPSEEIVERIVTDAGYAPSSGNDQPWKWYYAKGRVFLFHEVSRSYSFGDYKNMASYISLGTAIENFVLSTHYNNLETTIDLFPVKDDQRIIASFEFFNEPNFYTEAHDTDYLYPYIQKRHTNRKIEPRKCVAEEHLSQLKTITESIDNVKAFFSTEEKNLRLLGEIVSACDRMRILHPHGHFDFFKREMRWSTEEALIKRDGMDINTLEIPQNALMALKLISDETIVKVLRDINGAKAFKQVSVNSTITASAMGLITTPSYTPENFVLGGRAVQRQWLKSTELGYAYQPLIAPLYLFPRVLFGKGEGLSEIMINELHQLRDKFLQVFPGDNERGEIFLFRIFKADNSVTRSLRLPLDKIFFKDN